MLNFDIEKYYNDLEETNKQLAELKKRKVVLEDAIIDNFAEKFNDLLSQKPEPFGAANVVFGEFDMTYTSPKKVTWDQAELAKLHKKISEHEDASVYIKTEYSVSETAYKNWPEDIKAAFLPARSVSNGKSTIEIEKLT